MIIGQTQLNIEFIVIFGITLTIILISLFWDWVVMAAIYYFSIPTCPIATGIANTIYGRPEQWIEHWGDMSPQPMPASQGELIHPSIGAIRIVVRPHELIVRTRIGPWQPNAIERRIIHTAVYWRIHHYQKEQKAKAIQKHLITTIDNAFRR